MSSQILAAVLQHTVLWETEGEEEDWSHAYWGFPQNQYTSGNILARCRFCLCLHTAHYILFFGQIM